MRSTFALLALLTACDPSTAEDGEVTGAADASPVDFAAQAESDLAALPWADRLGDIDAFRVRTDALDMTHVKLQQLIDGVPVFGGEAIAHYGAGGALVRVTDSRLRDVSVPSTTPRLDDAAAIARALAEAGLEADELTAEPVTELLILRHEDQDRLVWSVQLKRIDPDHAPTMPRVFVDARRGDVVWTIEELRTAEGHSSYDGEVSFDTHRDSDGMYYMEDHSRRIGTYSFQNTTSSLSHVADRDDYWDADSVAVDAHYGAREVHDYFKEAFDRDGVDGANGPGYVSALDGEGKLQSMFVHYSRKYNNAFYSGDAFVFGDGDGRQFSALAALDVVAHEMTHGVNASEAGFIYSGESGALDEGIADVFASLVERAAGGEGDDIYHIGEDCYTPGTAGDALRYMDSPSRDGFSPDHYSERYRGNQDNGGVHVNAGIVALSFYLMAEGGAHPTGDSTIEVTGVGHEVAAAVWYRALTTYMTSSSSFSDARNAVVQAAEDLYGEGSLAAAAAANGWHAVGVGAAVETPEHTDDDSPSDTAPGDDTDSTGSDSDGTGSDNAPGEGAGEEGAASGSCASYGAGSAGELVGRADFAIEPGGVMYNSGAGTHRACLAGPEDADLLLVGLRWTGERWRVAGYAQTEGGVAELSLSEEVSGRYTWLVAAFDAGEGAPYSFGLDKP